MNITNKTVSSKFRGIISQLLPNLNKNQTYWTFFGYLAFGTWRDEETGKLIISQEILAQIENKQQQYAIGNYNALIFLKAFSEDVLHISWSDWSYSSGKSRVLESVEFPDGVFEAITAEQQKLWKAEERVYLLTGIPFTQYKQRQQREETRNEALQTLSQSGCKEAQGLLLYMNQLPPNYFFKMLTDIEEAKQVAQKLSKDNEHQLNLLNSIQDQYMPFYTPVQKSVRIYPLNENLAMLKREVRQALTSDWIEADLKSAQLAIIAKVWDIPELTVFLSQGKSIWKYLAEVLDIDLTEENKQVIKTGIYALCFGASKKTISSILTTLNKNELCHTFFNNELITAIFQARNNQYKKVIAQGGITDCFGRFLSIKDNHPRSILAQECQAIELKLLYPVIQLAQEKINKTDGFTITLWQHDGFSFVTRNKNDVGRWINKMKKVVLEQATKLDIQTSLEIKSGV